MRDGRALVLKYACGVSDTYVFSRTARPTMDTFCDDASHARTNP